MWKTCGLDKTKSCHIYVILVYTWHDILPLNIMWISFSSIYECSFTTFIILFLLYFFIICLYLVYYTEFLHLWYEQWHTPILDPLYYHPFFILYQTLKYTYPEHLCTFDLEYIGLILFFCAYLPSKLWHHDLNISV